MLYRKSLTALLALALTVGLTACSSKPPEEPEPPESQPSVSVMAPVEPEPALPYVNPLTGEGCARDIAQKRPVAVMLNNLKKALPQLGVSQADIIYEAPAEGGITRMLAVFQSVEEVGNIGSVRSARDYYVSLAMGHDALYLHAGGSPGAYAAIKNWGGGGLRLRQRPIRGHPVLAGQGAAEEHGYGAQCAYLRTDYHRADAHLLLPPGAQGGLSIPSFLPGGGGEGPGRAGEPGQRGVLHL